MDLYIIPAARHGNQKSNTTTGYFSDYSNNYPSEDECIEDSSDEFNKHSNTDSCYDKSNIMEFINYILHVNSPVDYIMDLQIRMPEKTYYIYVSN